ncbi:polyprenyl synthetase family protein [Desulfovibrio sp. JC010]|uniref:polyprenyl synthetase family protein n=1 Tax=Desulfovibrio sp. JC010 TaxID=2593641 RepID=UPI0013D7F4B9|nr:polyprenyl synthetase family protein [Desulfovibrio sp. JC010]NDV25368.1 polyprenyl synthetase family protein [Desulfovibrio sp. JC010]
MIELLAYFEKELPLINDFLDKETAKLEGLVKDVARHVLLAPGKRIRPVLTILSARGLGYGKDDIYPLAGSLELLHAATLLHDDILDDADLRRGVEASHLVFGTTETILAGDVLLALANRIGADYGKPRISSVLASGIMATVEGEILEIAHISEPLMDRDTYMDIIIGKTARLIETSCRLGAILASDDREKEDALGNFGLNMGIAFQLVDDALDYESPADDTGKPEGGDLREGKITLPLILYLEMLQEKEAEQLLAEIKNRTLSDEKREHVLAEIRKHGLGSRTRTYAAEYVEKAKSCLAPLPESEEKQVLKQAADFVLTRKK